MARGLRVIAGSAGGLRLVAPKGARPTTDRVKESLFASLGDAFDGVSVLDLYAGSGALGIEALSRGARHATFVDDDRDAVDAIRRNLDMTKLAGRSDVVRHRVERALGGGAEVGDLGGPFDLVFLDPPYSIRSDELAGVLQTLDGGWVETSATVVVERRTGSEAVELPRRWQVARDRRYGDTLTLVLTVHASA